jgi:hypothetical protein
VAFPDAEMERALHERMVARDAVAPVDAYKLMMPERSAFTVSFHTWKASAETRLSKG